MIETHYWPIIGEAFDLVREGEKTAELRAYERKYAVVNEGDVVVLQEMGSDWKLTGEELETRVTKKRHYHIKENYPGTILFAVEEEGLKSICPPCDSRSDLMKKLEGIPNYDKRIAGEGTFVFGIELIK